MENINETTGYQGRYQFIVTGRKNVSRRPNKSGPPRFTKLGTYAPKEVTWNKSEQIIVPRKNKHTPSADGQVSSTWPIFRDGAWVRDDAFDKATRKFYSELANTNALLPLMFKERQKTIDLVTDKVIELIRIKKNFRKRVKHLWKKHDNKAVHNAWLEYQYGWIPTILDINTLVNKPLGHPKMLIKGTGFGRHVWTYKSGENNVETYFEHNVLIQALAIAVKPSMQAATQYGVANPSLVLWEAVPYSFVVDWVFDIGGYLESLGALNGIELIGGFTSRRTNWSQQNNMEATVSFEHGYSHWRGSSGTRTLGHPAYPNPLIPSNGMNLKRFADAAALLRNLFKK